MWKSKFRRPSTSELIWWMMSGLRRVWWCSVFTISSILIIQKLYQLYGSSKFINTLKQEQNDDCFADDIFQVHFRVFWHFSGPSGVPMPWDCNAPPAASDVHTSLPREAIRSTGVPMAGRVTLQEPDAGGQAPYSMGMTYGRDHLEVRAPRAQISPGMLESNLGIGMPSTPDHREYTPVELGRNDNLLAESVTAPTDVTYNLGARASAASELVSRNLQTGATVSVIPDTTLPLSVSTHPLECMSLANASAPAVFMQTRQDTIAGAQASVVSVASSRRSDHVVTQTNDVTTQVNPVVPGLNYNVFPILPPGQGSWPSSNPAGSEVERG